MMCHSAPGRRWADRPFVAVLLTWVGWASLLVLLSPGLATAEDPTPIPHDFSKPDQVFAATLSERFSNLGVAAHDLYLVLEAGDFVLLNRRPATREVPWLTTSGTLVNAPPALVYQVVADVSHYHEFMPETKAASATPIVPGVVDRVDLELSIQVLFTSITNAYSLYYYYQPPHRIDWVLAQGEFEANCGAFELVPVPGDPGRTILLHTSYALPRNKILGSLFARVPDLDLMVNLTTGTMMMEAIKHRAETQHARTGGTVKPAAPPPDNLAHLVAQAGTLGRLARRGPLTLLGRTDPPWYTGILRVRRPRNQVFDTISHIEQAAVAIPYFQAKVVEQSENGGRYEVESVIPLMIDFDAEYVMDATFAPPDQVAWTAEAGGDLEGYQGTWKLIEQGAENTLVFYHTRSNLESLGFTMRKLLEMEPLFEHGIHVSEIQRIMAGIRRWAVASPEERARLSSR